MQDNKELSHYNTTRNLTSATERLARPSMHNPNVMEVYMAELTKEVFTAIESAKLPALNEIQKRKVSDAVVNYYNRKLQEKADSSSPLSNLELEIAPVFRSVKIPKETITYLLKAISGAETARETTILEEELAKGGRIVMTDPSGKRNIIQDDTRLYDNVTALFKLPLPDFVTKSEDASVVKADVIKIIENKFKDLSPRALSAAKAYVDYRFEESDVSAAVTQFRILTATVPVYNFKSIIALADSSIDQALGAQGSSFSDKLHEIALKSEKPKQMGS